MQYKTASTIDSSTYGYQSAQPPSEFESLSAKKYKSKLLQKKPLPKADFRPSKFEKKAWLPDHNSKLGIPR
jgi:hypothetical protein